MAKEPSDVMDLEDRDPNKLNQHLQVFTNLFLRLAKGLNRHIFQGFVGRRHRGARLHPQPRMCVVRQQPVFQTFQEFLLRLFVRSLRPGHGFLPRNNVRMLVL